MFSNIHRSRYYRYAFGELFPIPHGKKMDIDQSQDFFLPPFEENFIVELIEFVFIDDLDATQRKVSKVIPV